MAANLARPKIPGTLQCSLWEYYKWNKCVAFQDFFVKLPIDIWNWNWNVKNIILFWHVSDRIMLPNSPWDEIAELYSRSIMWKYFNLSFHMIWSYLDLVRPIYACILENWVFIVLNNYDDVTMSLMASQITSLTIVYPTVYSGADQREHQSSASLAFVWGIHLGPVNSPHKWPVTRKMFPFDDVIMITVCRSSRAIFHKSHWWIAYNAHKNGIQLWASRLKIRNIWNKLSMELDVITDAI